jgi:hypothetical protein
MQKDTYTNKNSDSQHLVCKPLGSWWKHMINDIFFVFLVYVYIKKGKAIPATGNEGPRL